MDTNRQTIDLCNIRDEAGRVEDILTRQILAKISYLERLQQEAPDLNNLSQKEAAQQIRRWGRVEESISELYQVKVFLEEATAALGAIYEQAEQEKRQILANAKYYLCQQQKSIQFLRWYAGTLSESEDFFSQLAMKQAELIKELKNQKAHV